RIRWFSKEYIGIALLLLGSVVFIQAIFIILSQYFFGVGNYFVITIIPLGVSIGLFYAALIIYESFIQVHRRRRLRNRFIKDIENIKIFKKILNFPITKPILITAALYIPVFLVIFAIGNAFIEGSYAFIIAQNIAVIFCLIIANAIERSYAKVVRY
ncbi:MAG: hypothetical protein P8Y70_19565, partial [Candidatus Lokiarchaeota archaeon]